MTKGLRVLFLAFLSVGVISCGGGGGDSGGGGGEDVTPTVSFSASVQPIFTTNCVSCHAPGGVGAVLDLRSTLSYANLVGVPAAVTGTPPSGTLVVAGDHSSSVLYQRITGDGLAAGEDIMPQGLPQLSSTDKDTIENWIDQGAANN